MAKIIIYIFAIPLYLIKVIIWCIVTIIIAFFGALGSALAITNFDSVAEAITDLWKKLFEMGD